MKLLMVARHSLERMSHAMTINLGTTVADIFLGGAINRTRNTVGQNTGLDIFQLGIMNHLVENKRLRLIIWFNFFLSFWF